eukprot:CAMPEP_0201937118 /NCGR_PEP_ID=MMETSP0903-20130614/38812_1 /ASSEMBLY_ACC=CAM_ASM_000552 /TAXON_ID=420261 /ORGANISM="Thalassiosira antarctica, Strain CCMP982" /LENGTH=92 /DNA_ID=CAMNT_0048477989 /DNA_START=163 /DNA_END=441 /DNA_ORIENTATION=+
MPWVGRLLLSLLSKTIVSALSVSPGYTGFGNNTSENPRLATVVPCVVSGMLIPTRSANVNMELNNGFPAPDVSVPEPLDSPLLFPFDSSWSK